MGLWSLIAAPAYAQRLTWELRCTWHHWDNRAAAGWYSAAALLKQMHMKCVAGESAVAAQVIHQSQLKETFFWKVFEYGILVPSDRCHHMEEPADNISQTQKASDAIWALLESFECLQQFKPFFSNCIQKARGRN